MCFPARAETVNSGTVFAVKTMAEKQDSGELFALYEYVFSMPAELHIAMGVDIYLRQAKVFLVQFVFFQLRVPQLRRLHQMGRSICTRDSSHLQVQGRQPHRIQLIPHRSANPWTTHQCFHPNHVNIEPDKKFYFSFVSIETYH